MALEMPTSFRGVRLGRHQCDFTNDAIGLGLKLIVMASSHAVPSIIELAKLDMRNRQM